MHCLVPLGQNVGEIMEVSQAERSIIATSLSEEAGSSWMAFAINHPWPVRQLYPAAQSTSWIGSGEPASQYFET